MSDVETKIMLQDETGRTWNSTRTYESILRDFKDIQEKIGNIYTRIIRLEDDFETLIRQPMKKQATLDLMASQTQPRTRMWFANRTFISYRSFMELVQEGKIRESRVGKNRTVYLYELAERKTP